MSFDPNHHPLNPEYRLSDPFIEDLFDSNSVVFLDCVEPLGTFSIIYLSNTDVNIFQFFAAMSSKDPFIFRQLTDNSFRVNGQLVELQELRLPATEDVEAIFEEYSKRVSAQYHGLRQTSLRMLRRISQFFSTEFTYIEA